MDIFSPTFDEEGIESWMERELGRNGKRFLFTQMLNIINEYFPLRNRVCFFFFYVVLKTFSINA